MTYISKDKTDPVPLKEAIKNVTARRKCEDDKHAVKKTLEKLVLKMTNIAQEMSKILRDKEFPKMISRYRSPLKEHGFESQHTTMDNLIAEVGNTGMSPKNLAIFTHI